MSSSGSIQPAVSPPSNSFPSKDASDRTGDENGTGLTITRGTSGHEKVVTEIRHASKSEKQAATVQLETPAEVPSSTSNTTTQNQEPNQMARHRAQKDGRISTDPDGAMPFKGGSQSFTDEGFALLESKPEPTEKVVEITHMRAQSDASQETRNDRSADEGHSSTTKGERSTDFPVKDVSISEGEMTATLNESLNEAPSIQEALSPASANDLPSIASRTNYSIMSDSVMPRLDQASTIPRSNAMAVPENLVMMEHPSLLPRMNSLNSTENTMNMVEVPSMLTNVQHGNMISHVPAAGAFTSYSMHSMAANVPVMTANATGVPPMPNLANSMQSMPTMSSAPVMIGGGKRKIHIRLIEEVRPQAGRVSFLNTFRRQRTVSGVHTHSDLDSSIDQQGYDRGRMTISWYEGTSSLELQEHVRNSVVRKLGLGGTNKLADFRILDESVMPPEETVLSPYIPDGSKFLLRFTTKDAGGDITPYGRVSFGPPDSPSAAPSPHPAADLGLSANQLALLSARLKNLNTQSTSESSLRDKRRKNSKGISRTRASGDSNQYSVSETNGDAKGKELEKEETAATKPDDDAQSRASSYVETTSLHPEDPIEARLNQITELLLAERTKRYVPRQEKRQVVFVLANYFVLFLSLIAISAEIQARAPQWHASMEQHLKSVQNCATDQDALFECVSNGDLAGLIASVLLWLSRSAATKRIFLFGFESPKKLWTVVYESMVTAVCWGFSYMFIRRGMNPDTTRNFLQKYWKDAVYGSLAGFNAAFMKHVLKNLIPQEAIEDALQDRQLKILSWLPSFAH